MKQTNDMSRSRSPPRPIEDDQDLEELFTHTVEFETAPSKQSRRTRLVSIVVNKITKTVRIGRNRNGGFIYAIHLVDGSRTFVHSDMPWAKFQDYLFDPARLRTAPTEKDHHVPEDEDME